MYAVETILVLTTQLASLLALATAQSTGGVVYYNPILGGGSMLADVGNGYGEPMNVIVSGESSPGVLTYNGIVNYARAIGFSKECAGIHVGDPFTANLGDGNGWVQQSFELRQDYDHATIGTCWESLVGGNHFRVFRQNGTLADSGAAFLAVSQEQALTDSHNIVPDGYDIGRNNLVAGAIGTTSFGGVSYNTQAQNITGLLAPGADGVNHDIAQDGIVTLLTVTIV